MNWKLKALIQNLIGVLPSRASYAAYHAMQRGFGRLKDFDPFSWLAAAVEAWDLIREQGRSPGGKAFFEIGTGWVPLMPVAYWLMGAGRTVTVDLNPLLRPALIGECLETMSRHEARVRELFGGRLDEERFRTLMDLRGAGPVSAEALFDLCGIDYRCGVDAARTGLADGSVDFHGSFTVLEHIPRDKLREVLIEGRRIARPNGLFVHFVDYSDHFSHTDPRISALNFLRYSDARWRRYSGNRFMYMNRLRHDDVLALLRDTGHQLLEVVPHVNRDLQRQVESGEIVLHDAFLTKPPEVLATVGAWIVSRST